VALGDPPRDREGQGIAHPGDALALSIHKESYERIALFGAYPIARSGVHKRDGMWYKVS